MPTYEYRCTKCKHEFEVFQKMSDKAVPKCPKCGTKAERLLSGGAGLVFKGTGFYITDYKRAGEKKPAEDSSSSSAKPDPKPRTDSPKSKKPKKDD